MSKYSDYVLKKVEQSTIKVKDGKLPFIINDKYEVRFNRKTDRFDICTCKFYREGKTRDKMCSHMLSILYHLNKIEYYKEITEE